MSRSLLSLAVVALSGCGAAASTPRPCPSPMATGAHVEMGPLAVTADRAHVRRGTTVTFTISVTGPAAYQADCGGPVQLLVTDSSDLHVHSDRSAPGVAGGCGDVMLAEGQRQVYSISWRPELTLPPGAYAAVLLLGDQPSLTVPIVVEAGRPEVPRCR